MSKILFITKAVVISPPSVPYPFKLGIRDLILSPVNGFNGLTIEDIGNLMTRGRVSQKMITLSGTTIKKDRLGVHNLKEQQALMKVLKDIASKLLSGWPKTAQEAKWDEIGEIVTAIGCLYQIVDMISQDIISLAFNKYKELPVVVQRPVSKIIKSIKKSSKVTAEKKLTATQLLKAFSAGEGVKASSENMETLLKALTRIKG